MISELYLESAVVEDLLTTVYSLTPSRSRFWLFLSYVVSMCAVIGAVWVLLAGYVNNADRKGAHDNWPGAAVIIQVVLTLGAGLIFFSSRSSAGSKEFSYSYTGF